MIAQVLRPDLGSGRDRAHLRTMATPKKLGSSCRSFLPTISVPLSRNARTAQIAIAWFEPRKRPPIAVSFLAGFRTPADSALGHLRARPASETLHKICRAGVEATRP